MSKPWADTPYALLPIPGSPGAPSSEDPDVMSICIEMANVHNSILRGLNAIYHQAPHITLASDIEDFVLYVITWADLVHHHHGCEEKYIFPAWEELAKEYNMEHIMDHNVDQHHLFETPMNDMIKWCEDVKAARAEYDAKHLQKLIDAFGPILTQHLHDEISTLLKLEKVDSKKARDLMSWGAQIVLKELDPALTLPVLFGSIDKNYPGSENFPPVPFFLPWLNAYWYTKGKYQGLWRFNPCDNWGYPRPLQFV